MNNRDPRYVVELNEEDGIVYIWDTHQEPWKAISSPTNPEKKCKELNEEYEKFPRENE